MPEKHNKIENITNIVHADYATDDKGNNQKIIGYLKEDLEIELNIINNVSAIIDSNTKSTSDIFFIDQKIGGDSEAGVMICRHLRENGYKGIMILCVQKEPHNEISDYIVTSIGFDNFLPLGCTLKTLLNQIHWAILNRRRKNKNILMFDNNPDSVFTIDKNGVVHDINETATINSPYTPKEIVTQKINIRYVGTLPTFDEQIKPLIMKKNVNRVFEYTSDESGITSQVKVMITSLPVIGLVATVFKTNISHVMFSRTLDILTNSISLLGHRDFYTAGHSSRVFHYCRRIIEQMKLTVDSKFTKSLYCAALLHDIGKIGVKDHILLKPGKLEDEEFNELATHPEKGCEILKRYIFLEDSVEFIKHHHERPDGSGYPNQLTGKDIPMGAAIIAVADSFDAMTSNRPYRNSLDYKRAVNELKIYAGTQFDYDVAQAFLRIISPELVKHVCESTQEDLESITREILALLKGKK
jgi:HD-GYP domain-containing protein (c-di-GMP phosphodiesterase class II)